MAVEDRPAKRSRPMVWEPSAVYGGASPWAGRLAGRREPANAPVIDNIVEINNRTSSGTFKATSADGGRWWVKPLNNPCGARVPVTELIVGLAGKLLDAPVCEVSVVAIDPDLEGEIYGHDCALKRGYAVGSRDVPGVVEGRELKYGNLDDNSRRHVGVFALYDWCWGADTQWLYAFEDEQRTHSHDHGYYLPGRPSWTAPDLRAVVDVAHPGPWDAASLDVEVLESCADRLERMTADEIWSILSVVPPQWPVTEHELETVGWFLERRATPVAGRLRRLMTRATGGHGQ